MYHLILLLPLAKVKTKPAGLPCHPENITGNASAHKELIIGHQNSVPCTPCAPSPVAHCAEHPWMMGGRTQRTTGCKNHTCADTDLLQHKTSLQKYWKISCVKLANYQETESRDMDQPCCSYTQKMTINSFQQSELCSCLPISQGPPWELSSLHSTSCPVFFVSVSAEPTPQNQRSQSHQVWATVDPSPEQDPSSFPARILQRQRKKPSCVILLAKVSSMAAWKAVNNSLGITGNVSQMKRL